MKHAPSSRGLFRATGKIAKQEWEREKDDFYPTPPEPIRAFLAAEKQRGRLWADHPPARIYLMRWRIDFTGQGAPPMLNAWFVWERGFKGNPPLMMLDKPHSHNQSTIFEVL